MSGLGGRRPFRHTGHPGKQVEAARAKPTCGSRGNAGPNHRGDWPPSGASASESGPCSGRRGRGLCSVRARHRELHGAARAPLFGGTTALPTKRGDGRLGEGVEVQSADGSGGPLGVAVKPRKMGAKCKNAPKLTRSEYRRKVSLSHLSHRYVHGDCAEPRPRLATGGGAGPGAPWEQGCGAHRQESPGRKPRGVTREARGTRAFLGFWAPRTHPEPALALAAAVGQLHLAQGDGVDEPVDQLLADLLRGAL